MNTDILLKLLYNNGLQNVVTRAVQLENEIPFKHSVDEEVIVEANNEDIKALGLQFSKTKGSYGYIKCPIVGIDKYDLEAPYIVRMPNGSVKKYSEGRLNYSSNITEMEEIPNNKPKETL